MLSYLHGFHAGNHADVFKHAVLTLLLDALLAKPKPLVYIDSHAGAGLYDLHSEQAEKTGEHGLGIGRVWPQRNAFPELANYFTAVDALNDSAACSHYPGSPAIAQHLLGADDKLILMELHKTEVERLRDGLGRDRRINIHYRDGFEGLPALLPPKPMRGLVLIDPPYEVKTDYRDVARCVGASLKRWSTGVYAIWYPKLGVQRDQSESLLHRLLTHVPDLLVVELSVEPQLAEFGMHGSGMAIINPPWQFEERLRPVLSRLADVLAQAPHQTTGPEWAGWRLERLSKSR